MHDIQRATVLASGQLRHLLRVTEATSRHPERDAASRRVAPGPNVSA